MALFRFRVRSPERDRETDSERLKRLKQSIATIRAEMDKEREGLRGRYDKVMADAAFSQEALENDNAGSAMSSRIDTMTDAMIRYTRRMADLQRQVEFVTGIEREVEAFFREDARAGA